MPPFPSRHKDNSEDSTGLIFMRVYNKWHDEIKRRLKKVGITHPQFVVLTSVGYIAQFHAEISQVMIAHMADMDVMSVSQILTLLEKKGYIHKQAHSKDTRANAIRLSQTGQQKMASALPIVEEVDRQFFGSLQEYEPQFRAYLKNLQQYTF